MPVTSFADLKKYRHFATKKAHRSGGFMLHPRILAFLGDLSLGTSVLYLIAYEVTGTFVAPAHPLLFILGGFITALALSYAGRKIQRLHSKIDQKRDRKTQTTARLDTHVQSLLRLQRYLSDQPGRYAILHTLIDLWDNDIGWTDTTKALLTKEAISDIATLADIDAASTSDWRRWIYYQRHLADESSPAA